MHVAGWKILDSYFSTVPVQFNTSYGVENFQYQDDYPLLTFSMDLKRYVFGPLITYMIPILIIIVMLFAVLRTISRKNTDISGYNSFGVINTTAAFFFVSVLQHIDLRSAVVIQGVTYMELYYFVTYFFLLLVTIDSIAFTDDKYLGFVDARDNTYPKLLYWPVFFIIAFLITLANLYF
jgi:hypothetical protein